MKLAFLGAGNMAEALVKGILKSGLCPAASITVSDTAPARLDLFQSSFGVRATGSNREAIREATVIVLAVKPQVMAAVCAELQGAVSPDVTVISIAAGTRIATIEQALGGNVRVVRVMPNTPALVGQGVSAVSGSFSARKQDVDVTMQLMKSVGIVVHVAEEQMDAVTALSGSGPAYVFYLMEAMLDAATQLGLAPDVAALLVGKTMEGAGALALGSATPPAELRTRVTSKGGTTAAAIAVMDEKSVKASLTAAVLAAHRRSRELSGAS